MSIPATTQIMDKIEARLANITIANGYNFDLKKITRSKSGDFQNGDLPEVDFFVQDVTITGQKYNKDLKESVIFFRCFTNKTDKKALSDVSALLAADFVMALDRDISAPLVSDSRSRDLGGLVNRFYQTGEEYLIGDLSRPWAGVDMSFTAEFSTPIGDPYTIELI